MPQESERPRPHGDPMSTNPEEPNAAQRNSDATPDVVPTAGAVEAPLAGTRSDANGIGPGDEADGARRRKLYDDGAELVSRID